MEISFLVEENAEAFILLSMVFTGALSATSIDYQHYFHQLGMSARDIRHTYEIRFRYLIRPEERFEMKPGFQNFQEIKSQEVLATSEGQEVRSRHTGRIFKPLYQSQGVDGFFEIKRIKPLFLKLSETFRKNRLDRLLVLLPGIYWMDKEKSTLMVNRKIARFLAKDLLHLFGYRQIYKSGNELRMVNREYKSRTRSYKQTTWMS
ncbi:MAG: hypothetical protein HRT61_14875 [Ekhidna sp.]|nr:hypothetical protein [Ekhidna sp.]